jgi:dephospho-CoA kinase
MLKIAITGNIGSGKTIIANIFSVLGIPVYNADKQSKKFLYYNHIKSEIKHYFGNTVFDKSNEIDKKALANIVFNDKKTLNILNSIIHPAIKSDFNKWIEKYNDKKYIIHEAAILFESGFYKNFDKIITVTAPQNICIKRVMIRDSILKNEILQRIKNQLPEQEKIKMSDFVIYNDEKQLLIPQVLYIHKKILEMPRN